MRNLIQYPITDAEIIAVLTQIKQNFLNEKLVDDIRPVCIEMAIGRIKDKPNEPTGA